MNNTFLDNLIVTKLDEIDSTNDYLQRYLESGEAKVDKNYLVIANYQSNGHGSKGRVFISDKNKGIYFSLLVFYDKNVICKNNYNIEDFLSFITPNVCVAIKESFECVFNIDLDIKWVNDLYYNNKKVVGVLCKHYIDKNAIIIGIGIDLYENTNLPCELQHKVGYIFETKVDNNVINDFIIKLVSNIYKNLYIGKIKEKYFENNIVLNKQIRINNKEGKIISINKKGHLIVKIDDHIEEIDSYDVEINI